jgi:polyisoprenoid-binding protein YceI
MKTALLLLALIGVAPVMTRGETYQIDPAQSRVAFRVRHFLGEAKGQFHQFRGTIVLDRDRPERSSVNVMIAVRSIDTKIRKRDEHLLSADFFDAARFREITFRSRKAMPAGPDRGDITGELTMHGVTRPLTLHVKLLTPLSGDSLPARTRWLVTAGPIKRKEFGLAFSKTAEALFGVGREITPVIEIEAVRAK